MSAFVVATIAEKGGVGKTSLTTHVAALFGSLGYRILAIDMDKQGDLSAFFLGREKVYALPQVNTVAAIIDDQFDPEPSNVIHETQCENVFCIPSNKEVLQQFMLPEQYWRHENVTSLRDFIDEVRESFDLVFIDTHPDVDTLPTWVTLMAADFAITPVEPEEYSAHSTVAAAARIQQATKQNPRLAFLGFIVNKFQTRRNIHHETLDELRDYHGDDVFDGALGNLNELAKANSQRTSLEDYSPKSNAAGVLRGFADQMIQRMKESRQQQLKKQRRVA